MCFIGRFIHKKCESRGVIGVSGWLRRIYVWITADYRFYMEDSIWVQNTSPNILLKGFELISDCHNRPIYLKKPCQTKLLALVLPQNIFKLKNPNSKKKYNKFQCYSKIFSPFVSWRWSWWWCIHSASHSSQKIISTYIHTYGMKRERKYFIIWFLYLLISLPPHKIFLSNASFQ